MSDAYYLPRGDARYDATEWTSGPWSPELQHGGAPSALLARAVEQVPADQPMSVVRMSVDLLGPVPVGPLELASRVLRSGRRVDLVQSELSAAGRVAVRAQAWRMRVATLDLPPGAGTVPAAPELPGDDIDREPAPGWAGGFLDSLQTRFVAGGWAEPGPATVWARIRGAVVDGEEPTGLQRLMALADCGNGVSARLPIADWTFINTDLSVHLARQPQGEWLCLQAETAVDATRGFGLATSRLYDKSGQVATGAQSLLVSRR